MDYVWAVVILLLCSLLLLFPELARDSALEALQLWWERIIPSLFPFCVLTSMLSRTRLIQHIRRSTPGSAIFCFLLGGLSGYPTGARLSCLLHQERFAPWCNLCGVMFLLSVVSIGICKSTAMFAPIAIGHYGSALLFLFCEVLFGKQRKAPIVQYDEQPVSGGIIQDIGDGMLIMLRIGGCIVFFYMFSQIGTQIIFHKVHPAAAAVVTGLFEITSGCTKVGLLTLPSSVKAGLLTWMVSFGGFCIYVQTRMTTELANPRRYILCKIMQSIFAGLIAYLLTPLLVAEAVPTLAVSFATVQENTILCFAFVASSCLGLVGVYLFAQIMRWMHPPKSE